MSNAAQHTVDIVTSGPATGVTATAGFAAALANLPLAIQIVTLLVLLCQLVAWGYKFYRWVKKNNK